MFNLTFNWKSHFFRKKKLLEKQKEGKKRMKSVGTVDVPQDAFMAILSYDDDEE